MGSYFTFSNNCHFYLSRFDRKKAEQISYECATVGELPELGPSITEGFDEDLKLFMPWAMQVIRSTSQESHALNIPPFETAFMQTVAAPMFLFWVYRKWKDDYSSSVCLDGIDAPDWQRACREWRDRRKK